MRYIDRAVMRKPAQSVENGLCMADRGAVDPNRAIDQYLRYQREVFMLGYELVPLPSLEQFPDSVFVEDPAVIIQKGVQRLYVTTRLRHPSRQGEEAALREALAPEFDNVAQITGAGFLEGGDVLVTDDRLYIGLSARTNEDGARQLADIARDYFNMPADIFPIPDDWLHLKGGCSYHRGESGQKPIILAAEQIAPRFYSSAYDVITIFADEHCRCYGANALSKGKSILIHEGTREAKRQLKMRGFSIMECDLSEFRKIDGAMTCLSKIFQSPLKAA